MARLKRLAVTVGVVAAIATILSFLLTVCTVFFPETINGVTSDLAGPVERTATGTVRPDYVSNQVQVFLYTSLVVVLLAGVGIGGAYYWSSGQSAESVARGRGKSRWLKVALVSLPMALTVLLAIYLPRTVFQPTNVEELGQQFFLGAWALRSVFGGLVLGVAYLLISGIVTYVGFVLSVQLPRSVKLSRYQEQLEN